MVGSRDRIVINIDKDDEKKWISNDIDKEKSLRILKPFDEKEMEAYTISKLITARGEDPNIPEVLKPFQYNNLEPLSSQKSLF